MPAFADLTAPPVPSPGGGAAPSVSASASSAAAAQKPADARSAEFRPVSGAEELQSGEKLLVEAYAAAWVVVFALVLVWMRRHKALDERMDRLERSLERAEAKKQEDSDGA